MLYQNFSGPLQVHARGQASATPYSMDALPVLEEVADTAHLAFQAVGSAEPASPAAAAATATAVEQV